MPFIPFLLPVDREERDLPRTSKFFLELTKVFLTLAIALGVAWYTIKGSEGSIDPKTLESGVSHADCLDLQESERTPPLGSLSMIRVVKDTEEWFIYVGASFVISLVGYVLSFFISETILLLKR